MYCTLCYKKGDTKLMAVTQSNLNQVWGLPFLEHDVVWITLTEITD